MGAAEINSRGGGLPVVSTDGPPTSYQTNYLPLYPPRSNHLIQKTCVDLLYWIIATLPTNTAIPIPVIKSHTRTPGPKEPLSPGKCSFVMPRGYSAENQLSHRVHHILKDLYRRLQTPLFSHVNGDTSFWRRCISPRAAFAVGLVTWHWSKYARKCYIFQPICQNSSKNQSQAHSGTHN